MIECNIIILLENIVIINNEYFEGKTNVKVHLKE